MRAYSMDLRVRVLAAAAVGETTAGPAERFAVSPAWVRRLRRRPRQTGGVAPGRPRTPGAQAPGPPPPHPEGARRRPRPDARRTPGRAEGGRHPVHLVGRGPVARADVQKKSAGPGSGRAAGDRPAPFLGGRRARPRRPDRRGWAAPDPVVCRTWGPGGRAPALDAWGRHRDEASAAGAVSTPRAPAGAGPTRPPTRTGTSPREGGRLPPGPARAPAEEGRGPGRREQPQGAGGPGGPAPGRAAAAGAVAGVPPGPVPGRGGVVPAEVRGAGQRRPGGPPPPGRPGGGVPDRVGVRPGAAQASMGGVGTAAPHPRQQTARTTCGSVTTELLGRNPLTGHEHHPTDDQVRGGGRPGGPRRRPGGPAG